jgi:rhodanese-related sulfurtransferase
MSVTQILLVALLALVIFVYVKRLLLARSMNQYSPSEIAEKLKSRDAFILLDVRTSGERQSNHIKGSLHIPIQELGRRMNELSKYKSKEVVCYCQSGSRSLAAAAALRKHGFTVANMKGGIAAWNYSGLNS